MAIEAKEYQEQFGVSGIVRESSKWREDSGGFQKEYTTEVIVCIRKGKPVRMKVEWVFNGLVSIKRTHD